MALFLQGLTLGFSAAAPARAVPGVPARAVRFGTARARTLPVALVPLVSDPPVIAVVLAVLAQVPAGFLRVLADRGRRRGPLARGGRAPGGARAPRRAGRGAARRRAASRAPSLVNFTNPNAWIFWSLVGGPDPRRGLARRRRPRALVFLAGFYLFLVGGNVALVLLAGQARRLGPRFARGLGVASGLALVVFGALAGGARDGVAGAW